MRIVACPTCRQLKAQSGVCKHCGELADVLASLRRPGAGQSVVYPFAALKKLDRATRRAVSQAIHNGRRGS